MKPEKGKVYLIGAGPGDPGLLTVKAAEILKHADVIVYDELVNPRVLDSAPADCLRVYAGKKARRHYLTQAQINSKLVQFAKNKKCVVRLKGGDPYVFGRGAEEGVYLRERKVAFEVVPGITSGIGCATYAGFPLTERHLSSSVAFVTAHQAEGKESTDEYWASLVRSVDTLVIYMGAARLSWIREKLLENGCDASMPVAVVRWGTWTSQRSYATTLGQLNEIAKSQQWTSPLILVVGKVVSLRSKLNWFETLPLFAKTGIVTRSEPQGASLRSELEKLGSAVIEMPVIEIREPLHWNKIDGVLRDLKRFDWLVFTSANGVAALLSRLSVVGQDLRSFGKCRIAAVGPATRDALKERGLNCDLCPKEYSTDGLLAALKKSGVPIQGSSFLLVRPDHAPKKFNQELQRLGADVTSLAVYRTYFPTGQVRLAASKMLKDGADYITFTSASTVSSLFKALGIDAARKFLKPLRVYSIGPMTSRALRFHGVKITAEAQFSTIDGLVKTIREDWE